MHTATLTNDQLDNAITTAAEAAQVAGLDTTPELGALFDECSRRIAARRAEINAAEDAMAAELDAAAAEGEPTVKVKLTQAQADRLEALLPESLCGLHLTASRAYGTPSQYADALGFMDDDMAMDFVTMASECEEWTLEREDFMARQVRRSMALLRRKLRAAARR